MYSNYILYIKLHQTVQLCCKAKQLYYKQLTYIGTIANKPIAVAKHIHLQHYNKNQYYNVSLILIKANANPNHSHTNPLPP